MPLQQTIDLSEVASHLDLAGHFPNCQEGKSGGNFVGPLVTTTRSTHL